jgi:leucyl aminopeptidase
MIKVRLRHRAGEAPGAGRIVRALPLPQGAAPPPALHAAAAAAGFAGAAGQDAVLATADGRVALIGIGAGPWRTLDWEAAGGRAVALAGAETSRLVIDAQGLPADAAAALAAGACLRAWRPAHEGVGDAAARDRGVVALDLLVDDPRAMAPVWDSAAAAVRGCLLARDLTGAPANELTPKAFVARLEALAEHGVGVDVLGRKRLERLGAGALLAVGGGSAHGPRLAVLRWRGSFAAAPVVFVGKGICFDTGGLSLKRSDGMAAMRSDMAGAAACAGAMLALALRRSPAPAVAVLAIAENATGAAAYRPGDVLRMLAGRTVEVVDTDAEGRLVLADALHYARTRFRPRAMLDIGTLTGAVVGALGHHRAGLYGSDAALMAQAAAAGEAVGEPVWPLPIADGLREALRSDIADLRQCVPAGRLLPDAGHAAAFLREFAGPGATPWAHLDIAGVALREAESPLGAKGASGFGARLLDRLVARHYEA